MSTILTNASRLKPDIRLAQAVSQFEMDLSSEQKTTFRTCRSESHASPPKPSDVMRLTAEIDRRASGKVSGRCFGPRFTNFLQVVQQFAALGDVVVGGSQSIVACGVWSLVRMSLLVSIFIPAGFSSNIFIVNCKLLVLSRKAVNRLHERRSLGTALPSNGATLSSIQESAITPL
jgi:hypothetical protein